MKEENKNEDFKLFINSWESPNSTIDNLVTSQIYKKLNPTHSLIWFKLVSVQAIVGTLTLLLCPQFNFSLTNNYKLFHFFHQQFGHYGCSFVCGLLFLGIGFFVASLILQKAEISKINQSRFLFPMSVSGLFIFIFFILGADVYLDAAIFWFAGSSFGALLSFEIRNLSSKVKFKRHA